jgi:C1A family cysteine protease
MNKLVKGTKSIKSSKGLGWIPDYPDARDYTLDSKEISKNCQPHSDETTSTIENLANNMIKILSLVKNNPDISNEVTSCIDSIHDKVFGGIEFKKIKIYKILRLHSQGSEVVDLKIYFALLEKYGKLKDKFTPQKKYEKYLEKQSNQLYLQWLKNPLFDKPMQAIVKHFQKTTNLTVDGVVGLKTLTKIKECLNYELLQKTEPSPDSIKFLVVPSLIPHEIYSIIFANFKRWGDRKDVQYSIDNRLDNLETFTDLFRNEYLVVEPIVSTVLGFLAPLSQYPDLETAANQGFAKIFKLFDRASNDDRTNHHQYPESFDAVKILLAALKKSQNSIKEELKDLLKRNNISEVKIKKKPNNIKGLIETLKNKNIEEQKCLFYDFVYEISKRSLALLEKLKPINNNSKNEKLNELFNKSFLIEISNLEKNTPDFISLFSEDTLHLPVNRKLPEPKKETTSYYFLPDTVDLSFWCSPVQDQRSLNCCTAFAGTALLEYFARRRMGKYTKLSPLFLYKAARNLMKTTDDVGASIRETMRAMTVFGVAPEKYWTYDEEFLDEEPDSFHYSYAQQYQTLKYFRLDEANLASKLLLFRIKAVLAAGFPCAFGFTVYNSINQEYIQKGYIPYPSKTDEVIGGHAVVAVGYDDYRETYSANGELRKRGALLIRNAWGKNWGIQGYGWLPYDYVLDGLTADWWSILKAEWFDTGNFGLGAYAPGGDGSGGGGGGDDIR